nr:werner syndrome-like exonuclease [Ipomoea batatas]
MVMSLKREVIETSYARLLQLISLGVCKGEFSVEFFGSTTVLFPHKICTYLVGTCKATTKFRALQQVVVQVLYNGPQPGPAVFAAQCLYVLPIFESYCEGFSHLILSALRRFMKLGSTQMDILDAKCCAAKLFLDIVGRRLIYDERIMVKIVEVFNVDLSNIGKAICGSHANNETGQQTAKIFVQQYILNLIDCNSYMTAVSLLEQFSLRGLEESFLLRMMDNKEYKAAEKWATFMGKQYLCTLVQEYIDRKLENDAYEVIRKNNLREEFPEAYHQGKERQLVKLAEKGCWDIAEARTKNDRQLLEYLVYLAMEAGYMEKVEELCNRYSLEGFTNTKELEASAVQSHYLQLKELSIEEVVWVDNVKSLQDATHQIEECKVVGLDCEWKPNYEKGSLPNKVSIMQIASERKAYILDLIKLYNDVPDILDDCLVRILHSPRILKLGYNFQCDVAQLARSYGRLECFKHYDMLLDIQNVFKEPRGGLSGLAKKILGTGLNKTRRNSNWEQRPLTQYQLEYAALDAAVLIHIFRHVRGHTQPAGVSDGHNKIEWKSHIVSHMDNSRKGKKETKKKEQCPPTSHGLVCLDAEFEQ